MTRTHHASHSPTPPTPKAPDPTIDLMALYAAGSGPAPRRHAREPEQIEITLEARETTWQLAPGTAVTAWAYQGQVPGPLIVGHVGDTVVVRLINHLPEPTTIHWHGLRLAPAMDGTDSVQTPVQPGETFEYRFVLTDAGTYWYHSHTNETVQLERGLYGALVVRGAGEPTFDGDRVLVLDDVKLNRKRQIAAPSPFDRHAGREGSTLLINGRAESALAIAAGHVERWRIVNACSARYVRLSLGERPFTVIGSDGGLRDTAFATTEVLLVPGDRVELVVGPFDDEGAAIAIESLPYRRTAMKRPRRTRWGTLHVGPRQPSRSTFLGTTGAPPLVPLVPDTAPLVPTRTLRLGAKMTLHGHDWLVNGEMHHRDEPVKAGELQVWNVINETGMDHPFHLHGFFFQVLAQGGVRVTPHAWEDTVNVVAKGSVTLAFVPDARPGEWMYHCHILEHHAAGMMGHFEVIP